MKREGSPGSAISSPIALERAWFSLMPVFGDLELPSQVDGRVRFLRNESHLTHLSNPCFHEFSF